MISGYSKHGLSRIALGTHMGSFSEEDSKKYIEAISYALQHGITSIDTAINYRGMCSEKDFCKYKKLLFMEVKPA